jgi:hypothetical protein
VIVRLLAIAAIALSTTGAHAQEPAPKPSAPAKDASLLEFARTNPGCTGFTDMCQTCVKAPDQAIRCSTPGIACIKQAWTCTLPLPEKPKP